MLPPPTPRSHPRIGLRARHRLGWRRLRRHALLRRGHLHHLWLRLPSQGAPRRGLEVGRLQRGRRLRGARVPGVRGRSREQTGRALGHEQAQQRGGPHGEPQLPCGDPFGVPFPWARLGPRPHPVTPSVHPPLALVWPRSPPAWDAPAGSVVAPAQVQPPVLCVWAACAGLWAWLCTQPAPLPVVV